MKNKLEQFIDIFYEKELSVLPGNLAYSFTLAIIPILSLIFYVLTSFHLPVDIFWNFLSETLPSGINELLQPIFFTNEITLNSFLTISLSMFVTISGCNAIIISCNTIYKFKNSSLLKRIIKSIVLTGILILLLAFIIIVPLLGKSIINLIGTFTDFISNNQTIINIIYAIARWPLSLIIMFIAIKLVYTIAPDEKIPSKYVNKGSIFTTISWLIVTGIFSYYINHIARYDLLYGNLANLVMLLFWFYILAYIFVIGLFLNKEKSDKGIEKTNAIKLEEIRKKVKEEKNNK